MNRCIFIFILLYARPVGRPFETNSREREWSIDTPLALTTVYCVLSMNLYTHNIAQIFRSVNLV